MRFLSAAALGVVASAVALAACDGPRDSLGPNETPSFSRISTQTQYTATLTCNAVAAGSRSSAAITFQGVLSTNLFCNSTTRQVTATSFSEYWWAIVLEDNTGVVVKECPRPRKGQVFGISSRTGEFTCKDTKTGMSVVLTVAAS